MVKRRCGKLDGRKVYICKFKLVEFNIIYMGLFVCFKRGVNYL